MQIFIYPIRILKSPIQSIGETRRVLKYFMKKNNLFNFVFTVNQMDVHLDLAKQEKKH